MNIMMTGLRAFLAPTSTFFALLLFFAAAAAIARKQQWAEPATCANTIPLSITPQCPLDGDRYAFEHSHLLRRIDRKKVKWDKKHPRWEILDALHAYDIYEETAGEEIKRFEGLYKHVPAKHKKVSQILVNNPTLRC